MRATQIISTDILTTSPRARGYGAGAEHESLLPAAQVYPYLLRGVRVTDPNQVWSTDITYIRLARGFVSLVAVIDWYSRKVLAWRVSNTLESGFCVEGLEHAVQSYGIPEIFNTDQGCQFTADVFTGLLKAYGIAISMDGRGRVLDTIFVERLWRSVKHEDVYLNGYTTMSELRLGLTDDFVCYNTERRHQSLNYVTPDEVCRTARGGGARIVDQFGKLGIPLTHVEPTSRKMQNRPPSACAGRTGPFAVSAAQSGCCVREGDTRFR